jgi:hypothetical protein
MFDENNVVRPNYKLFLKTEKVSHKKLHSLQHATDRAQLSLE